MALNGLHTWKLPTQQSAAVHHAVCPDPYRSPFPGPAEAVAARSVEELRSLIRTATTGQIAAFIAEPIQGVGGVTHGDPAYLREAYRVTREYGGLCISDEVQTGFGRTGARPWGFELHGVTPDIVTMGKPVANGFPLGVVVTRREIMESFMSRTSFFSTFGGNNVACAAGMAVLEVLEREQLQASAQKVGEHLKAGLRGLMKKHDLIGDVRGMGLMIGVELVTDRKARTPATKETKRVLNLMRDHGVLVGYEGRHVNIVKVRPPMPFKIEHADQTVDAMDKALRAL
jgi:alanine-glyoxylate transaminase/(R)-3-amino-2-methylpropionate-pyruvate transaminase